MTNHHCDALIGTCIDFRFQEFINKWISENFPPKSYDRVAFAGCVKNFEVILDQIRISKRLHDINRAVLINHEDCGAYGQENIPDEEAERLRHSQDLNAAAQKIKEQLPDLEVETYYLHLDGTFSRVN